MEKYYTRACNFYHGKLAKKLIKNKLALPLCGKKDIAFDKLEIFVRNKNKIKTQTIHISKISSLNNILKLSVKQSINNIIKRRMIWWKETNSGSRSKKIAITATS